MSDFMNRVKAAQKVQTEKPKIPTPQAVYNELNKRILGDFFESIKNQIIEDVKKQNAKKSYSKNTIR